jgi:hypothetical protein
MAAHVVPEQLIWGFGPSGTVEVKGVVEGVDEVPRFIPNLPIFPNPPNSYLHQLRPEP